MACARLPGWLDAFDRAPGSGAAGVSFALGFRRQTTISTKNNEGAPFFSGNGWGMGN
jgi:hypothetical protein